MKLFVIAFLCGLAVALAGELKIASFNIQHLSLRKLQDQSVKQNLAKILSRYDLVFIQEVRASDREAAALGTEILKLVNTGGRTTYNLHLSAEAGTTRHKERYGLLYKPSMVSITAEMYAASRSSEFERPPMTYLVTSTKPGGPKLVIVGCHVKPSRTGSKTAREISELAHVQKAVSAKHGVNDAVLMGDFNADSNYMNKDDWAALQLVMMSANMAWLIKDGVKTNLAYNARSYDRSDVIGGAAPFDFKTAYQLSDAVARKVSDHFPIEMKLKW